jgi:hypothetical protein
MISPGNMREKGLRILAITAGLLLLLVIIFLLGNMLTDILSETVK